MDIGNLEGYPYAGHGVILGRAKNNWQDVNYIWGYFGGRIFRARREYRKYMEEGVARRRRKDLTRGGLIRSMGGWVGVKD